MFKLKHDFRKSKTNIGTEIGYDTFMNLSLECNNERILDISNRVVSDGIIESTARKCAYLIMGSLSTTNTKEEILGLLYDWIVNSEVNSAEAGIFFISFSKVIKKYTDMDRV